MSHRTDRTISSIIGHLEALSNELPQARNALLDQRNRIDGYPSGSETPRVTSSAELTPTESAASQREHIDRQLASLNDELNAIALIVRNLRGECQRHIASIATLDNKPRCDGGAGRSGHLIPRSQGGWSEPSCENIPADGRKTCDNCRQRAKRWARDNGIRTSNDA